MAEFSSFNGYTVKDAVARNIAKGRNQAVAYSDYETMIETLNATDKEQFKTGQNIYIGTVGVPDLWVYSVEPVQHTFNHLSDDATVELLKSNVTIQCGYYKLAMLEGQKVDLTTVNEQLSGHDRAIGELNSDLEACFQSVSDGKSLVASAITGKGVTTAPDATFETMAENIKDIITGYNVKYYNINTGANTTSVYSLVDETITIDKDGYIYANYSVLRGSSPSVTYTLNGVTQSVGQLIPVKKGDVVTLNVSFKYATVGQAWVAIGNAVLVYPK